MAIQVSIEGYDSLEQIGVGGMAAVYKARKVSIDKIVAVKILFPYLANDESFIERFQREARSAAKLQHENIVNVIDFGESGGAYYIVMEYYEGLTLAEIMKRFHQVPLDIAVLILLEVCLGLEAAHAKDVVHRDIKPGNIICTRQGGVKIADFGLAKNSDAITVVTQPGKVLGTPAYMSPEQAAGRNIDPPSDIFSLGVCAYELFCNKRPFEGRSHSEVLERIQTADPPPITDVNPLIQPDFEAIIRKMLEKDLSRRYRKITEVVADLEKAMDKFEMTRDCRRLAKFIKSPEDYKRAFNEKLISRCLSQGTYFLQKGKSHLEDAKLEFKRILYLDPGNDRAKKYLLRVMSELGDDDRTAAFDKKTLSPHKLVVSKKEANEALGQKWAGHAPVKSPPKLRERGRLSWRLSLLGILVITVLVLVRWGKVPWVELLPRANTAPELSVPEMLTVSEGEIVEFAIKGLDADNDSLTFSANGLPEGATFDSAGGFLWQVAYGQAGTHRIRFFADDGSARTSATTVIEAKETPLSLDFKDPGKQVVQEGQELKIQLAASSPLGKPVTFELEDGPRGMRVHGNQLRWRPDKGQTGTFLAKIAGSDGYAVGMQTLNIRVKSKVKKPSSEPEPGKLSVYFLGGVGEFLLDGERFKEQPPFTGVMVEAGRHIVTCRMLRDGSVKEFEIMVKPGGETVVEYEIGKEPVVHQVN